MYVNVTYINQTSPRVPQQHGPSHNNSAFPFRDCNYSPQVCVSTTHLEKIWLINLDRLLQTYQRKNTYTTLLKMCLETWEYFQIASCYQRILDTRKLLSSLPNTSWLMLQKCDKVAPSPKINGFHWGLFHSTCRCPITPFTPPKFNIALWKTMVGRRSFPFGAHFKGRTVSYLRLLGL